jgi:NAD(P)-dependent dehydrogenase (short-subunit alcohol dehydrogenase family)
VVTGAGRGVGRAIAERLAREGAVVALDREPLAWEHPRVTAVTGDAGDEAVAEQAADAAERAAPLGHDPEAR